MKLNRIFFGLLILCFAVTVMVGCKGKSGSRPGLVKAGGTVIYKGAPVDSAILEFRPAGDAPANSNAAGRTDAQGKFTLMTDKPGDGALPGKYKVVVKKQDLVADKPAPSSKASGDKKDEEMRPDKNKGAVKNLLPEKYADPGKTTLEVEIPAGGSNDLKIELAD